MSYQGREGWFKEHTTALTKGKYWLEDDQEIGLGWPVCKSTATGYEENPIKKAKVTQFTGTAGAKECIGVSLDIKKVKSGVSNDDIIMRPAWYFPRDMLVMQIGICPIKNMSTGYTIPLNETVVPATQGCEGLGTFPTGVQASKYTLGKALQDIPPNQPGLVWVNPQSFAPFAH